MTLDDAEVRELCRIRDAGTLAAAAAAASHNDHPLALVGDATIAELGQLVDAGESARHQLMENGVGLVRFMIGQLGIRGEWADVFQEGMLAVATAVDTFDPDRGSFSSFMWPHIRGAVLHAIATDSGRLHLTSGQARDRARVMTEVSHRQGDGATVTTHDLAAALNMSESRVDAALAYRPHAPLSDPLQGGADVAAPEPSAGDRARVPLERYVGMLPSQERTLVQLLYGFTGSRHTSAQIASLLSCSPSSVNRLRNQAVEHLQELLDHFDDDRGRQPARGERAGPSGSHAPGPAHHTGRGSVPRLAPPSSGTRRDQSRPI